MRTLAQLLDDHARIRPEAVALDGPGAEPVTYAALREGAGRTALQLRALGVSTADRVALILPGGVPMVRFFLGVASAAAAVPLNPRYRGPELERYLSALRVRLLVSDSPVALETAERLGVPAIPVRVDSSGGFRLMAEAASAEPAVEAAGLDDAALVLQTSGSTATPKGVPLTQRNLLEAARQISRSLALASDDVSLDVMPLFHVHGLVVSLLSALIEGGRVVCLPEFEPRAFFRALELFHPTWYSAAPTLHQAILESAPAGDLVGSSSLRLIRSSAAPLPAVVMRGLESTFGVPVLEGYGMSECPQICLSPSDGSRRPGSVGKPAGPEVRVVGPRGEALPAGAEGEIVIRGESVIAGYDDPADSSAAFRNGWLRTGDLGCFERDGQLRITGRLREMINRGGEKIAPREVEEALLEHAGVAQAVACAVPHPRLGEEVGAAVVRRRGAEVAEEDLRRHVSSRLAEYKVPNPLRFVGEIPTGPTGKPDRDRITALLLSSAEDRQYSPPVGEVETFLAGLWQDFLKRDRVGRDWNFFEAGGDSILAAQILTRLRERFDPELSMRAFFEAPTVASLAAHLGESERGPTGASQPQSKGTSCVAEAQSTPPGADPDLPSLSLFFFSAEQLQQRGRAYELLLSSARLADRAGFSAIWTPERHFTTFGGPYPNPSVLGAALAAVTERVGIRAGSVVLPLHDPLRVAEEWAVVDNLSEGRVGIAAASGWHSNDFLFFPDTFDDRKTIMFERLETLRRLWRGESVERRNGSGQTVRVSTLPRPVQKELPVWLAAHSDSTFAAAGEHGFNVLTTLYNTSLDEIRRQTGLYRQALARGGRDPAAGIVTLMVHTFVAPDLARLENEVSTAYARYLDRSLEQQESAGWAFPTRSGNRQLPDAGFRLSESDRRAIIERATGQLLDGGGLVGQPDACRSRLQRFKSTGVDEVACLIDFGVEVEAALESLDLLARMRAAPVGQQTSS